MRTLRHALWCVGLSLAACSPLEVTPSPGDNVPSGAPGGTADAVGEAPPLDGGADDGGSGDAAVVPAPVATCGAARVIQDPINSMITTQFVASDRQHLVGYRSGESEITIWDRATDESVSLPGQRIVSLESHGANSWLNVAFFGSTDPGDIRWAGVDGKFMTADDTVTSVASIAQAGGLANFFAPQLSHQFLYFIEMNPSATTHVCSLDGEGGVATCGQGLTSLDTQSMPAILDGPTPMAVDLVPAGADYQLRLVTPIAPPVLLQIVPGTPVPMLLSARGPFVRIRTNLEPEVAPPNEDLYDALNPAAAVLHFPETTRLVYGDHPVTTPRGAFTLLAASERLPGDDFHAVLYFMGAGNGQRFEVPHSRAPAVVLGEQLFFTNASGALLRVDCTLQ